MAKRKDQFRTIFQIVNHYQVKLGESHSSLEVQIDAAFSKLRATCQNTIIDLLLETYASETQQQVVHQQIESTRVSEHEIKFFVEEEGMLGKRHSRIEAIVDTSQKNSITVTFNFWRSTPSIQIKGVKQSGILSKKELPLTDEDIDNAQITLREFYKRELINFYQARNQLENRRSQ